MKYHTYNKNLLPFLCIPVLIACNHKQANNSKESNIIFIMADDLGWMDLSCYGSTFYETPNLDSLAAQGMRFTNAYAACPVSSPTRVSYLTGRYPAREHITDWIPGKYYYGKESMKEICPVLPPEYTLNMPLERVTIAEVLRENGYTTAHIGKWHCCMNDSTYYPQNQGFDYNIGGCWMGSPSGPKPYFVPYNNPMLPDGPEGEYLTDRLTDECIQIIRNHKDKPFFINLSFHQVHIPMGAKKEKVDYFKKKAKKLGLDTINPFKYDPEYIDKQPFSKELTDLKLRTIQSSPEYAAMIASMDENIGRIIKELKAMKIEKNTIIFFMSDNGGLSTSEGSPTSNLPLKGGKGFCYEGGIREPMIVFWPGHQPKNHTCDAVVTSTDFFPTILDMVGIPFRPEEHLDGVSFKAALLEDTTFSRGDIFWHYPHYSNQGSRPSGAIRSGQYKLIEHYDTNETELFDLKNDIGEQNNIAEDIPEVSERLKKKLHEWRISVKAQMPIRNTQIKNNNFSTYR